MNIVAIIGSARGDGHSARLVEAVLAGRHARRFDLGSSYIRDYEYGRAVEGDDFLAVAEALASADGVLFATPVYWYAMSGVLKRFFDRLTDLVTVQKPLGRRLAGRRVWVAACGSDPALPEGFEVPFRSTAAYFHMSYQDVLYLRMREGEVLSPEQEREANEFAGRIFRA
jgi:putative NADPH-quinone reductase